MSWKDKFLKEQDKTSYYDTIKEELQSRWNYDQLLTSESIRSYNKMSIDPFKFGLVVWDWNKAFEKKIKKIRYESFEKYGTSDDQMKYKKWNGLNNRKSLGIPFQYIDKIPNWAKNSNWQGSDDIMGRFEGQVQYGNSSSHDFTIELTYDAECSGDLYYDFDAMNQTKWSMQFLDRIENQLKSLAFPQYDGYYSPPVKVLLNIGSVYIDYPIVIKSVDVEYQAPFEIITMRSMRRKITLGCVSSYPSWQAISATQVWTANTGAVFARQEFQQL